MPFQVSNEINTSIKQTFLLIYTSVRQIQEHKECVSYNVFQVYLIVFVVQWNARMESLHVAGGQGRKTTCTDARQIQRMNQQAELLFGKEHILEPNFAVPLPHPDGYDNPDEEELLGVEYIMCQSTAFTTVLHTERYSIFNHTTIY